LSPAAGRFALATSTVCTSWALSGALSTVTVTTLEVTLAPLVGTRTAWICYVPLAAVDVS
jgi:hypothetical protein